MDLARACALAVHVSGPHAIYLVLRLIRRDRTIGGAAYATSGGAPVSLALLGQPGCISMPCEPAPLVCRTR